MYSDFVTFSANYDWLSPLDDFGLPIGSPVFNGACSYELKDAGSGPVPEQNVFRFQRTGMYRFVYSFVCVFAYEDTFRQNPYPYLGLSPYQQNSSISVTPTFAYSHAASGGGVDFAGIVVFDLNITQPLMQLLLYSDVHPLTGLGYFMSMIAR